MSLGTNLNYCIDSWNPFASNKNIVYKLAQTSVVEKDPYQIPMHQAGAKADAGKVRMGLMQSGFPLALKAVAEITTYGAEKYTPGGWKFVPKGYERYYDAQARHQNKHDAGELVDPDFKCYHLAHEAWNSLAKLELFLMERKEHENDTENPTGVR